MELKYFHDPGFIYDLIFSYNVHFNFERFLESYSRVTDKEKAEKYLKDIEERFAPFSENLRIFFNNNGAGRNFISLCYFSGLDSDKLCNLSFRSFISQFDDREEFVKKLIGFYFPDYDFAAGTPNLASALSEVIDSSKYDPEIKCDLYSFIVDPEKKIRELIYSLIEKERVLKEYYKEEYSKILEFQNTNQFPETLWSIINHNGRYESMMPVVLPYSVTLLHYYDIWVRGEENVDFALVGYRCKEWIAKMNNSDFIPDARTFGEIISEPNRLGMIEMIKEKGEVAQKELEKKLNLTSPTAYYHLSMMQRSKMLKVRNKGKFVFYSLNREYFEKIMTVIKDIWDDQDGWLDLEVETEHEYNCIQNHIR
ncbi:MAG: helix-turn-helix transcriptional regulator [Clostridia bacterium]|nr:helix-turn-helix transcriptional regulator [Clostridia bacterium]